MQGEIALRWQVECCVEERLKVIAPNAPQPEAHSTWHSPGSRVLPSMWAETGANKIHVTSMPHICEYFYFELINVPTDHTISTQRRCACSVGSGAGEVAVESGTTGTYMACSARTHMGVL